MESKTAHQKLPSTHNTPLQHTVYNLKTSNSTSVVVMNGDLSAAGAEHSS